ACSINTSPILIPLLGSPRGGTMPFGTVMTTSVPTSAAVKPGSGGLLQFETAGLLSLKTGSTYTILMASVTFGGGIVPVTDPMVVPPPFTGVIPYMVLLAGLGGGPAAAGLV